MASRIAARLAEHSTPIILVALVALGVAALSGGSEVLDRTVTTDLIYLTAVVGLYVFVGNSGVLSFGHMAFMAIGAYAGAILAVPVDQKEFLMPELPGILANAELSPLVACLAAGAIAAAFGLIASLPIMRLSGMAASLTTFALLGIVYVVIANWTAVTNGVSGLTGIPTTATVDQALVMAVIAIVVAWLVQRSSWALRLQASREDEVAARALGISVHHERRIAFVISAFICGCAGGLYAQFLGTLSPDTVYLDLTFLVVVMLVVGGTTSLSGAVVGSLFISTVGELLRRLEGGLTLGPIQFEGRAGLREVGLALVMLIVLLRRPAGITGGRELSWPRRRSKPEAPAHPPADIEPDPVVQKVSG
jgi:branched-chain amino acid transport system permease protein